MKSKISAKSQSKDRAKHRCPPELEDLIQLVKYIPPEIRLRSIWNYAGVGTKDEGPAADFRDFLKFIPDEIKERILEFSLPNVGKVGEMSEKEFEFKWFPHFVEFREKIREIARYYHYRGKYGRISGESVWDPDRPQRVLVLTDAVSETSDYIDFRPDVFFRSLQRLEGDRIRICEVCEHIFWARRKDSLACSRLCANALRQRRFQDKKRQGSRP